MRRIPPLFVLLSLLFALLVTSSVRGEDWPTYQHDESRGGVTSDSLRLSLKIKWVYKPAQAPKTAWEGPRETPIEGQKMVHRVNFDDAHQVAIVGEYVYFGSAVDHHVYCVHRLTGDVAWKFCTEGPVRLAPCVAEKRAYFGSDDGQVYCLDAPTGKVVWQHRVAKKDERLLARGEMISRWPVRTGVLVRDGIAYFGAGIFPHETVYLCAARADSGEILWKNDRISQRDAGRDDLSPQGYLLASRDQLFVPSGRSLPAAFDLKTGEFVYKKSYGWRSSAGGVVGGSRAVLADGQLYSFGAHHFIALDQKSGSAGFAFVPGEQMAVRGERMYVANGLQVLALDHKVQAAASVERQKLYVKRRSLRNDTKERAEVDQKMEELAEKGMAWKTPFTGQTALLITKNVVVAGGDGQVVAIDIDTGDVVWREKVDSTVRGLAAANGSLLVSTTDGQVRSYAHATSNAPPVVIRNAKTKDTENPAKSTVDYARAAREILQHAQVDRGFCLVVGSEDGQLVKELARTTGLRVIGIESDPAKAKASRQMLSAAGLYGSRAVVLHVDPAKAPLPNYFANLVVSDTALQSGRLPVAPATLGRFVKPCGGKICLGGDAMSDTELADLQQQLATIYAGDDVDVARRGQWAVLARGKLPGAGDWSHQYGNVANTSMSQDHRVKGALGVLWYGDPGPSKMVNRHEAASAPLTTNGRFFSQGIDSVRAYDAYNGLFLWEYKNPGAIRTGVFNNNETSNLAANDDALFVVVDDQCTKLDAATGKVLTQYRAVQGEDEVKRHWGYVACHNGLLYGTSNVRRELARNLRRRGRTIDGSTDAVFAVDLKTDKVRWTYRGKNIMHQTIAMGDGRLFFVESSITPEQREALLRQDKSELKKLGPEEAKAKEAELKALDVRLAVALDANTGEKIWSQAVDITDCIGVSSGGGNLSLMYHDGHVVLAGANANGHYWKQFLSGQFGRRRLVVLSSGDGKKLWAKDADYMNRPVIVGDYIIAEPWAFDVATGKERTRVHPVTGEVTKWRFSRPGHHCGIITATPNMMMFRSGFIGYYDLYEDSGTSHFAGQRLGCWVNAIPGNGLVVIPEASAGCVCLFSIASTVVLEPRSDRDPAWGIYSATGAAKPVKHLAVNLGAPGDRRDELGTLWLGFPRPRTVGRLEYTFDIKPKLADGGGFYMRNSESVGIAGTSDDWIYTTGARGMTRCQLTLLDKDSPPAEYSVKLHFAELETSKTEKPRRFDILIQGRRVAQDVQIAAEAGGRRKALVRQFSGIPVTEDLTIELVPQDGSPLPVLSAIEAIAVPDQEPVDIDRRAVVEKAIDVERIACGAGSC